MVVVVEVGAARGGGTSIYSIPRVEVSSPISGGGGSSGGGGGGGGGAGGGGAGGGGFGIANVSRTNLMANVQVLVRDFFRAAGVDFPQTVAAGQGGGVGGGGGGGGGGFGLAAQGGDPGSNQKAIFFNDRTGILFIRATLSDLDIIEQAIQALNVAPPQVTIETKFAEVVQADKKALGFDWFVGNLLFGGGGIVGAQGGSAPTMAGRPSKANPSGTFPGYPSYPDNNGPAATLIPTTHLPTSPLDQKITGGVRNSVATTLGGDLTQIPALATVTGILTDPQFRVVIRAIEQRDGSDLLSAPKVTTLSGRQAKIQVADVRTIVTGVGNGQGDQGGNNGQSQGGGASSGGSANNIFTPGSVAITYTLQAIPFGPEMDVIPYVSADDVSIQMTLIPSYTEFIGYDDPGDFVPQVQAVGTIAAQPLKATLPLPHFRARSVTTSAIVWDGQTVVLGGLIAEDVRKLKDKVPFLGDIPFLGRLFRSEASSTAKRNLMIFVTPTIVDPAGNRVHDPNNMPYDPNSIPSQPTASR